MEESVRFNKLEFFARERGYLLERKGREIHWIRNDNKNVRGVSVGVSDAYEDISLDHQQRRKNNCTLKG